MEERPDEKRQRAQAQSASDGTNQRRLNFNEESPMFEVIISVVTTGRVLRRTFKTRDQAGQYANERLDQWMSKPRRSARDLRVEIVSKEPPAPVFTPLRDKPEAQARRQPQRAA
jgi:hypothetical protein